MLGVAVASLVGPGTGSAARTTALPPFAAILPKPGDITLETIRLRLPGGDVRLHLRWTDPKQAGKQAEALSVVKTSHTATSTIFQVFVAIANWGVPAGPAASEAPVQQHWCSGKPLAATINPEALFIVDEPLPSQAVGWVTCPAPQSDIEVTIFRDLSGAKTSDLELFAREAAQEFGGKVDTSAPGIDTGHYDDGHAFGWTRSSEKPVQLVLDSANALAQAGITLAPAVIAPAPSASGTRQPPRSS